MGLVLDTKICPSNLKMLLTILADGSGEAGEVGPIRVKSLTTLTSTDKTEVLAALSELASLGLIFSVDPSGAGAPVDGDASWLINLAALQRRSPDGPIPEGA